MSLQCETEEKKFMQSDFHVFNKRNLWWTWQVSEFQDFASEWSYYHNGVGPRWLIIHRK